MPMITVIPATYSIIPATHSVIPRRRESSMPETLTTWIPGLHCVSPE